MVQLCNKMLWQERFTAKDSLRASVRRSMVISFQRRLLNIVLNGVCSTVLKIYKRSLHFSAEREHHKM